MMVWSKSDRRPTSTRRCFHSSTLRIRASGAADPEDSNDVNKARSAKAKVKDKVIKAKPRPQPGRLPN